MDKQELEALDKLLAYVADEEKDFKTWPIENHIYRSIYVLMRYRGWDMSERVDPEKVGAA
jgi:hypothetical protein